MTLLTTGQFDKEDPASKKAIETLVRHVVYAVNPTALKKRDTGKAIAFYTALIGMVGGIALIIMGAVYSSKYKYAKDDLNKADIIPCPDQVQTDMCCTFDEKFETVCKEFAALCSTAAQELSDTALEAANKCYKLVSAQQDRRHDLEDKKAFALIMQLVGYIAGFVACIGGYVLAKVNGF